jgi:feruloyl-CoA hydratase/lyase
MSDEPTTPGRVSTRLDDGVFTLTLDRAGCGNLIDVSMSDALHATLMDLTWNDDVRVVVIEGRGKDFSQGIDPDAFRDRPGEQIARREARARLSYWRDRMLPSLPQPVIASIRGACVGGALAIVCSCDLAIAADDATFSLEGFDSSGPLPFGVVSALGRVVPEGGSALIGGCDAATAEGIGLVTRCVPAVELDAEVRELAAELAAKDPLALRFTKQTVRHAPAMNWDAAIDYGAAKFAQLKALQADRPSTRAVAVESFLSGKSKPGLG